MNWTPRNNKQVLAVPFLLLSVGVGPTYLLSIGDVFAGILSAIAAFAKAIADFFAAIGGILSGLFSPAVPAVSHATSQTYLATVHFFSDSSSYVAASISHTFQFTNPVQSVNVTLTLYDVASMHFRQIQVNFYVAGKIISIPVANPFAGPDVTIDSGTIILPSPTPLVGVTVDITGTLCGSSCTNLTFSPSADLTVSAPPATIT